MSKRQFRVSLSERDSDYLKKIANELDIPEAEVIRKGLRLMSIYSETAKNSESQNSPPSLTIKDGEKEKEIVVL